MHRRRVRVAVVVAAASAGALIAACSSAVSGHGVAIAPVTRPPGSSSSTSPTSPNSPTPPTQQPSVPSGVPQPVTDDFHCPRITYLFAHLSFRCVVGSMQRTNDPVWPLSLAHTVEKRSGWAVSMGAGHYGAQNGRSLRQITELVRTAMIRHKEYGPKARVQTLAGHAQTIGHHRGFVLESVVRVSAATRSKIHTKVHVERQWIAVVQIGRHDFSLWFVSIPDIAKQLWPKVPGILGSLRVS